MLSMMGMKLAGMAVLAAVVASGFFYVKSVISERDLLKANQTVLEDNIKAKETEIKAMNAFADKQREANAKLQMTNQESKEKVDAMVKLLGVNRIAKIASRKPLPLQKRMNKANREFFKSLREITNGKEEKAEPVRSTPANVQD